MCVAELLKSCQAQTPRVCNHKQKSQIKFALQVIMMCRGCHDEENLMVIIIPDMPLLFAIEDDAS